MPRFKDQNVDINQEQSQATSAFEYPHTSSQSSTLAFRIRKEVLDRSIIGAFFHIPVCALFSYKFYFGAIHPVIPAWPFFIIIAICLLRLWVYYGKPISNNTSEYKTQAGLFLTGAFVWGCIGAFTISTQGLFSFHGTILTLVIIGFLSGVLQSVSPSIKLQFAYLLAMGGPPILALNNRPHNDYESFFLYCFSLFIGYLAIGSYKSSKDIRKGLLTEISLRYQAEKTHSLLNSVPGFVAISDENQNWVDYSDSFRAFRNNLAIKKALADFVDSKVRAQSTEIEWTEVKNNVEEKFYYLISFEKVWDVTMTIFAVGLPIKDLKLAREELALQRSNAEYNSRLATLGEMAGGIAHEINNPLAVIQIAASMIGRVLKSSKPENREATFAEIEAKSEKIIQTTQRISKIIQGLQTFSRQGDRDPMVPVNFEHAMENSLELCRERFKKNGVLLDMDPIPQCILRAREVQISQVLLNLMNNAFDAIQNNEGEKIISLSFKDEPDFLAIQIQDNGHGVPDEIAQKIFQPFFTTKEVGKGTGLGLSISKGIIDDHGGTLKHLRIDEKTTFEIRLPKFKSNQKANSSVPSNDLNLI